MAGSPPGHPDLSADILDRRIKSGDDSEGRELDQPGWTLARRSLLAKAGGSIGGI
jgi:hypothetical protein